MNRWQAAGNGYNVDSYTFRANLRSLKRIIQKLLDTYGDCEFTEFIQIIWYLVRCNLREEAIHNLIVLLKQDMHKYNAFRVIALTDTEQNEIIKRELELGSMGRS